MTVRCPSNGRSASSTSGLLALAAQTSAGHAACSCLLWPTVMPQRPYPHPLLFYGDGSLTLWWVPASRGSIHFFVRNKEALPCVRRYSWWVQPVSGGNIFFTKYRGPSSGSQLLGGGIIILRVIRRHFLACGRGPSCQPLHVQSTSDACRSLTRLTRPRREHQGGGRRRGL